MRISRYLAFGLLFLPCDGVAQALPPRTASEIRVILLGTAGGPTFSPRRAGISTLVQAGPESLLFDAGRAMTTSLSRLEINPADVSKVFLTHLHSDHVISLPELWLYGWAQGRPAALQVWGPEGTSAMCRHLEQAFEFDIHMRRDLDEKTSAEGVMLLATDIQEGVIYEANGVRVTAFLVDHGIVKPAYGYRVDYRGHSVVLSGDTKPTPSIVKFAKGAGLLIHEVGRWKDDPVLLGPAGDTIPNTRLTRAQARSIAAHHTDGVEAGRLFAEAKPKLVVFSHYSGDPVKTMELVRRNYAGAVEFGQELMTVDVGDTIAVHRPPPAGGQP